MLTHTIGRCLLSPSADLGFPIDLGVSIDLGVPIDLGVSIDLGVPIDLGVSIDLGLSIDLGDPIDLGVPIDVPNKTARHSHTSVTQTHAETPVSVVMCGFPGWFQFGFLVWTNA